MSNDKKFEGLMKKREEWLNKELGDFENLLKNANKGIWVNNSTICNDTTEKPCNKLKWCPYGELVEVYPLCEEEKNFARENNMWAKFVKGKGWVSCGKDDLEATEDLNRAIVEYHKQGFTNKYSCGVFGHNCPAFYLREDISE